MKCEICHYPEGYHSISCSENKTGAAEIIKLAVEAVRKHDKQQEIKNKKNRHNWKLRNTRLLLDHYNFFKDHVDESICSSDQMEVIDIIAELDGCRESIDIESIKKSARKTFVFMGHIDKMISLYQVWCDMYGEVEQRRIRVLKAFYIDKIKVPDILEVESISERTFYRDIDNALNTLSALIFGIEAASKMAE
jgi:hypothetical protein